MLLSCFSSFSYAKDSIGFYYNSVDSVRELINYQRVVVNPDSITQRQLKTLHTAETKVFAYLSIGEFAGGELPEKLKSVVLMQNENWQSSVMDLTNSAWQQYLNELASQYIERGFDGLFLDTLDSYLLFSQEPEYKKSQEGSLVSIIDQLDQIQPNPDIIINRGFDIVSKIKEPVHAMVVESMYYGYEPVEKKYFEVKSEDTEWLKTKVDAVGKLGTEIIVIDYLPSNQRKDQISAAKKLLDEGYTPYVSDGLLMEFGVSTIVPIAKRVLGFYDGGLLTENYSNCHRLLAMPIEYLGYVLECVDVSQFDFFSVDLTKYAAVVSWLSSSTYSNMPRFQSWIEAIIGQRPILFMGALPNDANILKKMGIQQGASLTGKIRATKGTDWFTSTLPLFSPFENYQQWTVIDSTTESIVEIEDQNGKKSSLFMVGSWGGVILSPLPNADLQNETSWNIDPFRLISKVLNLPLIPAADATTESGQRILTIHIDGDGFPSKASFPGRPYVSEVILERILKKYKFPHTVSVIEGEVGKKGLYPSQSEAMESIARRMFRLPNVEAASHTFSHPFYWGIDTTNKKKTYGEHLPIPGYELDYVYEIVGSSNYIKKNLLPKDKQVKLILWSGQADPQEKEIKIAEDAGLLNVNGGNTVVLGDNPNLAEVSATIFWHPSGVQVYAPILNENVFTNLWTEHFDGYARVIETFNLLNTPRRLKTVSIYYHMYSGTYPASLKALKDVYAWAEEQKLTPLYLSEYAQRARTLYETGIAKDLNGNWIISSTGIKSLRLPLSLGTPNISSSNIAGWKEESDGHYLILNNTRTHLNLSKNNDQEMRLDNANAQLKMWSKRAGNTEWSFLANTPLEFEIKNAGNCIVESKTRFDRIKVDQNTDKYLSDKKGLISGTIHCKK